MKAAVVEAVGGGFQVASVELDSPIEREVVVEVKASGLCHSDLGIAEAPSPFAMPVLLGHEVAGVVVEVGREVRGLKPGDHVVACGIAACERCRECRAGRPYRCERPADTEREPGSRPRVTQDGTPLTQFMGIGGFAERVLVHENLLVPLDASIPFDRAALLGCAVVTGAGAAINTARISPADTVAVIGCGGVGLNVIQGAVLAGAERVIAVDLQPAKLQLATAFGATDVVDARGVDAVEAVRDLTAGGVTCSFEVIGLPHTAKQALDMLRVGGTAYLIGVQSPETILPFDLFSELIFPQKAIRGVSMGSTRAQLDIPRYADLYLQGRFKLDELVSQHISIHEINEGYEALRKGAVARSVVTSF